MIETNAQETESCNKKEKGSNSEICKRKGQWGGGGQLPRHILSQVLFPTRKK